MTETTPTSGFAFAPASGGASADPVGDEHLGAAIAACAGGDRDGIAQILSLEGDRLFAVAKRILGRVELAEEALQDAMIQIWRKADQHKADHGSARGWVYAILRNRCLSILRSEKRMSLLAPEDIVELQDARAIHDEPTEWRMLPGSSRLRHCLEQVEPATRTGILLAHLSGYSHGEVAAVLKVPLGTAKSWIRRGLLKLRECLS